MKENPSFGKEKNPKIQQTTFSASFAMWRARKRGEGGEKLRVPCEREMPQVKWCSHPHPGQAAEQRRRAAKQEFGKTNSSNSHHCCWRGTPGKVPSSFPANSTAPLGIPMFSSSLLVVFDGKKSGKTSLAAPGERRRDTMCWLRSCCPLSHWNAPPAPKVSPNTSPSIAGLAATLVVGPGLAMRAAAWCPCEQHVVWIRGSHKTETQWEPEHRARTGEPRQEPAHNVHAASPGSTVHCMHVCTPHWGMSTPAWVWARKEEGKSPCCDVPSSLSAGTRWL